MSELGAPVLVVGAQGSGTALLVDALSRGSGVWHEPAGTPSFLDRVPEATAADRLTAGDAADLAGLVHAALPTGLRDREGRTVEAGVPTGVPVLTGDRFATAVPLLAAAFRQARFVLVNRDPVQALSEAATSAQAWGAVLETLLDDLETLDAGAWCIADHARLLAQPRTELVRLCGFLGLPYDQAMLSPLEDARRAAPVSPLPEPAVAPARASADRARALGAGPDPVARPPEVPFRSRSTLSVSRLLRATGSSVLVSTYQSNRLVCIREDGAGVNTHLRTFDKPMGMAVAPGRLAIGTRTEVWDLRDVPAAAHQLEPQGRHDACFVPRGRHVTGDVAVHDLAFAGGELWLVATAFSCLATLDADHSFVPRWTPPFVSGIGPGDRCHLNGLAVVDDAPRYVTALGTTDVPGGWRAGKATGGVLLDVPSAEVVVAGLCMPHSPRWHDDELWVLESGKGELCRVDLDTGRTETVVELPGFTRGLAFAGRLALVGLSQIRESSTFGDLPLTARLQDRQCGVWVVDLDTGEVVGFLRFDDLVQEVFDVALLHGTRWPEIAEPGADVTAATFVLP